MKIEFFNMFSEFPRNLFQKYPKFMCEFLLFSNKVQKQMIFQGRKKNEKCKERKKQ